MPSDTATFTIPDVRNFLFGGTCNFSELQQATGYSARKLEYLIDDGLPVIRIGRDRRFDLEKTREWLLKNEQHNMPKRGRTALKDAA